MKRFPMALVAALGLTASAQAALQAPVNGQIYDDVLDVSWLEDANVLKTLCDANDPVWQIWPEPNPGIVNNSGRTKAQICTEDGRLNWYEAIGWIDHLNASHYLGHNDWRLPATGPVDGAAFDYGLSNDGSTDRGYNISAPGSAFPGSTGSEMPYMHYSNLGNPGFFDVFGNDQQVAMCPAPDYCVQNGGPFQNTQVAGYWSETDYAPNSDFAWAFFFNSGFQNNVDKIGGEMFVWAVRSGPVLAEGAPTLSIWALGLTALLLAGLPGLRLSNGIRSRAG